MSTNSFVTLNKKNNVSFLTFKALEKYSFLTHAFSTKFGGVSKNEFYSMNLGFNRGDSEQNVIENYKRFCCAIGIDFNSLVASKQDHKTNIRIVTEKEKGIGILRPHDMKSVDGLLTNIPGVTLVTSHADCTPIFYLDPVNKVVGLVHAGWRGTVKYIAEKMIQKMKENFNSTTSNIICVIGPTISPCCYEVDFPVYKEFISLANINTCTFAYAKNGSDNKYIIDLYRANKEILKYCGVLDKNIFLSDFCTKCHSDILFSHRATGGKRGGAVAMIALNK